MPLTFSCFLLLTHSPEHGTEGEVDGQVSITIDGSYKVAAPTSLWIWRTVMRKCVPLPALVSGGVQASELLPKGP